MFFIDGALDGYGAVEAPAATVDKTARARTALQTALERYDETTAEPALEATPRDAIATTVISDVPLPYLHDIGERWGPTHLSVAQEHVRKEFQDTMERDLVAAVEPDLPHFLIAWIGELRRPDIKPDHCR